MDRLIPIIDANTAIMPDAMITLLKLLNSLIAESVGKTINADVRRAPTKFMARTIITAVITAIMRL